MKSRRGTGKKPPERPKTTTEGAERIGGLVGWLYGRETPRTVTAEALTVATFREIAGIEDADARKAALRAVLERAYEELKK